MTAPEEVRFWVTPEDPRWPGRLGALTTTRQPPPGVGGGRYGWNQAAHVDDRPDAVARQRRALVAQSGVFGVQWLTQVHGRACFEAGPDTLAQAPQADAVWTRQRGLGLAILTADCVPVVLGDGDATVIGAAHGGWRGLVGGVLEELVAALPVPAAALAAWLGPAIGPDAYQVGDDVAAAIAGLADGDVLARRVLRRDPAPGHHRLDLFELSRALLERAGVGRVYSERHCTFSDARFYSYRRDGRTGRMATLAWLR